MVTEQLRNITDIIAEFAQNEGVNPTAIPGVILFKATVMDTPVPSVYNPCLCIVFQGHKKVVLDQEAYFYGPMQFLATSVELPLMNEITSASPECPYLLIKIDIDLFQISQLLPYTKSTSGNATAIYDTPITKRGIFIGSVDPLMLDGIQRLLLLLQQPQDIPILYEQILREIFYRVLCTDYGAMVSQIALKGGQLQGIPDIIRKINENFRENLNISELAAAAKMSVSSFHIHFKAITAMSPLQYQKTLRLIEARSLMLSTNVDAAVAAYMVGYQSPSQFTREYSRMFGNPPAKDISKLRSDKA